MKRKNIYLVVTAIVLFIGISIGIVALIITLNGESNKNDKITKVPEKISIPNCDLDFPYNVALEDLTEYEYTSMFPSRYFLRYSNMTTNASIPIAEYGLWNRVYPIEHVKKIDDKTICVVYKFSLEGYGSSYVYMFFGYCEFKYSENDVLRRNWMKTGELYFVSDKLKKKDYRRINVGDSMLDACKIDHSFAFDATFDNYCVDGVNVIKSAKLLEDGVMMITAEYCIEGKSGHGLSKMDDYIITSIEFYPFGSEEYPKEISLPHLENLLEDL